MYSEGRTKTIVKAGLVGGIVAIVLFLLIDLVDGPLYSFSTKTWSPELRGDKMIGGIEGAVKDADVATNTVRIASGFLGLASLPLVVTPDTKIAVKGKLGGFADLDRGQIVRVAYEVRSDQLVAWRVEVLDGSQTSDAVLPAEADSDTTATAEESSSSASVPKSVAAPPAEDTPRIPEPPAPTTLSRRSVSPTPVRQNVGNTTPATKRPTPPPSSLPRTGAPITRRPAPAKAAPAAESSAPGAPQAGDDAL